MRSSRSPGPLWRKKCRSLAEARQSCPVGLRFNVSGRWASERDDVALPVGFAGDKRRARCRCPVRAPGNVERFATTKLGTRPHLVADCGLTHRQCGRLATFPTGPGNHQSFARPGPAWPRKNERYLPDLAATGHRPAMHRCSPSGRRDAASPGDNVI